MPQNQRIRAHTKIPKIDRKIHKNHSSQEKEIDATMNASIQPEVRFSTKLWRKSSLQRKGIRKQSRSMRRHLTKELYIWSLSRCGKWPSYPYNSNEDAHPSVELWSKLGISHQVATPSPQFASSQCKIPPCVPWHRSFSVCPNSVCLRYWFCGSTKQPDGFLVNRRKPCVQTLVVSCYPTPTQVHDFVLLFLPPFGLDLISFGHPVHRDKPTCLSTPRRPRKAKTFHACTSPAPMEIKPQHAPGSDHPPVLRRFGPQPRSLSFWLI
jgi:hypothetical protein